jgi:RHS repeat-associated protein
VQWDNFSGLGLLYMHARHYAPSIGRFLQPDPAAAEANHYAYTASNPVTAVDPSGLYYTIGDQSTQKDDRGGREDRLCRSDIFACAKQWDIRWRSVAPEIRLAAHGYTNAHRNAYRHCIWSALMTIEMGEATARAWNDAHEADAFSTVRAGVVDQWNNHIGIEIGRAVKANRFYSMFMSEENVAASSCERALNSGRLVMLVGAGDDRRIVWTDFRR